MSVWSEEGCVVAVRGNYSKNAHNVSPCLNDAVELTQGLVEGGEVVRNQVSFAQANRRLHGVEAIRTRAEQVFAVSGDATQADREHAFDRDLLVQHLADRFGTDTTGCVIDVGVGKDVDAYVEWERGRHAQDVPSVTTNLGKLVVAPLVGAPHEFVREHVLEVVEHDDLPLRALHQSGDVRA